MTKQKHLSKKLYMRKGERYQDLEPLIKGSSFNQLFDFLYTAGLLRYSTKGHLNQVNPKLGTAKKLEALSNLGYLTCKNGQVFTITDKTIDLLREEKRNCKILAKNLTGEYGKHELEIATVILKEMKEPHFYAVTYPYFDYLIPDALLIYQKENAYKLTFLEVENEKPNWEAYLNEKKIKYERLARDFEIYDKWWRVWSEKLRLPFCGADKFCFGVRYEFDGCKK